MFQSTPPSQFDDVAGNISVVRQLDVPVDVSDRKP